MKTINNEQSYVTNAIIPVTCAKETHIKFVSKPLPVGTQKLRPLGIGKGLWDVSNEFFDPLPDELLDAFEGKN
jgi:hypothetical protein